MNSMSILRYKHYIATNTRILVGLCLLILVLGATIAFTGILTPSLLEATPIEEPPERTIHTASVEQRVSVDVLEDTEAFTEGQTLTDNSLYPRANASDPVITSRVETQQAEVSELSLTVTYNAASRTDTATPFYTKTDTLASETVGGSQAEISETLQINEVLDKKHRLEAEFGSGIIVTVTVHSTAAYYFEDHDGIRRESVVQTGGIITNVGNMYSLPSGTNRKTQTTGGGDVPDDTLTEILNTVAVLSIVTGAIGVLVILVVARRTDAKTVAWAIQKRRFQEWVTEVESYTPQGTVNTVGVTSLVDLVNLAIDTRRRVLFHREANEYLVVDGPTLFTFAPDDADKPGLAEILGDGIDGAGPIPPPPAKRSIHDVPNDQNDGEGNV